MLISSGSFRQLQCSVLCYCSLSLKNHQKAGLLFQLSKMGRSFQRNASPISFNGNIFMMASKPSPCTYLALCLVIQHFLKGVQIQLL
jgi:hypothetical protein